jgi:hypothetical protein
MSSAVLSPQDWLSLPVQNFFKTCNWENQSKAVQEVKQASFSQEPVELTLALSVNQFISAVNWEGVALVPQASSKAVDNAAAIEDLEAAFAKPNDEQFTLSNFSDLF